jgi:TolB-like protein/DNA-binding winged helix-turn-helix (wHTH) protein/Flp pilus assembly protein TadD
VPRADDPHRRLRFGVFEANLRDSELTKLGRRLRLQEQPFRLLVMLLEKPGELVTREQLREELWPQTTVDFEHGLNKAVSKIRDALGDSAENPRFIETVPRRGYRFLADVSVFTDQPAEPATSALGTIAPLETITGVTQVNGSTRHTGGGRGGTLPTGLAPDVPWRRLGLGFALFLAAALAWFAYPRTQAASPIVALAVLPLLNLSGDASQDYLADGMTEELITRLVQVSSLRVISHTSVAAYSSVRKPLPEIAHELGVQAVVEGSVQRSGGQVRITAELIDAIADRHIWAQSYIENLGNALAMEAGVARDITHQISAQLGSREKSAPNPPKSVDPNAMEAYLKGRYFWNKRTADSLKMAINYFNEAIQRDPTFAQAYSGLADSYALSGDWLFGVLAPQDAFTRASAAATKALSLDDSLAEAHTSLAFALDLYGWDWDAAEGHYIRAIQLNPGYATAHHWYGWHLIVTGRTSAGIAELRKAQNLDPLSLIIGADVAEALCVAHQYGDSQKASRQTLELDPGFAMAHYALGQTLTQQHQFDDAIAEFRIAIERAGHSAAFDSNLAYAYAISGRKAEALNILAQLQAQHKPAIAANIALIYVGLGDAGEAMHWLDEAYGARFNPSLLMRPAWDPLRPDPRFKDLLGRLGLAH